MENAIAACMKKQGSAYAPVAPEDPAASWTTYGADYALTKKYRQKYGFGIYAGIVYPDDAGASGSAADRQDSDRTPSADYVDTLTPEQKTAYSEALGAFPDPKAGEKNWTGCQGEADKEVYGSASAQERSIEAANRDQANAQALNGDPELVALVQSYASCLRKEGISVTTTQPTGVGETVRLQALRSAPAGARPGRFRRLTGPRSGQLTVVVAVTLVGAGGWFAGSRMQSPADAAASHRPPEAGPVTVTVERRPLTASVVAQGPVEFASPQSVTLAGPVGSPDSGSGNAGAGDSVAQRVTKAPAAGAEVKEGDVLTQVSGRPVLVLRGTVPMYRTLGPGASGDDAEQLQRALARLGFNPGSADGTYGQSDAAAVSRWYAGKDYRATEPTVADKQQPGTPEAAVTTAQQALLAARSPGGGSGGAGGSEEPGGGSGESGSGSGDGSGTGGDAAELELKSAQQQLDAANAALSAFQAGYGTKVPAGEVVFLPELPARLDKVSVKTGDTPPDRSPR
ncbi:hypothetical protein SUDANB15_07187 [Streptomyces sp. enrichment culture]|uniref:peptidoglycan-binding domain-containing protein n=1 Tax=Streptomyces sp. enrichment culture TaxID=1795815 RepID=UPI003F5483C2